MQDVVLEVVRFIPGPNDLVAFLEAVRPVDRSDVLRSLRALLLAIPPDRLWPEPMLDYAPDALISVFERALPAFNSLRIGSDVAFRRPPLLRLPPSTTVILTNASVSSEEIGDVFTPWPTHLIVMSIFLAWDDADTASVCRAWRGCSQLRHVDVQFETLNQMQLDAFMDVARTSWPSLQHFCLRVEKDASDASAEFESSDSLCAWLATTSATSLGLSDVAFHGASGIALSQTLLETKTALTSLALDHVDGLVPPSSLSSNLKSLVLHSLELTPVELASWATQLPHSGLTRLSVNMAVVFDASALLLAATASVSNVAISGGNVLTLFVTTACRLQHLRLHDGSFTDSAVTGLVELLTVTKALKTLALSNMALTVTQLTVLAQALPTWMAQGRRLLVLTLSQFDEESAHLLASVISTLHLQSAATIDLSRNTMSPASLHILEAAHESSKHVTLLVHDRDDILTNVE